MQNLEIDNPILEKNTPESEGNSKYIIIINNIYCNIIIYNNRCNFFFLFRNKGSEPEEDTPFDKIVKEDSEIHLIPKS